MTLQQQPNSSEISTTLREFIGSMQRLFKIGIYYPKGHAILDKATARFIGHLTALAGDTPSVTLEDQGNELLLEGIQLNAKIPFVQEFNSILSALGISKISIDRNISVSDLHIFVRKMLVYKSKMLNIKEFALFELSDFPPSITIKKKEFLARKDRSISDDRSGEAAENLEILNQSLVDFGLNEKEIDQCISLVESLPEQLVGTQDISTLPSASWDDIARLFVDAIKGESPTATIPQKQATARSNINILLSILKKIESEVHDKNSQKTINLLTSIIKKPFLDKNYAHPEKKRTSHPTSPEITNISIKQIQNYIDKAKVKKNAVTNIPESSWDNEILGIIMQMAQHSQSIQNQVHMQQFFREILAKAIPQKTLEILACGLLDIVRQEKPALTTLILRQLIEVFRRSKHINSLQFFLFTVEMGNEDDGRILWPYIVNEILIQGSSIDPVSYQPLCQFAANYPFEEMNTRLPQLQSLEVYQENNIAPDIFHAITPSCYPLFAFLLKTDIERYLEDRILGGLRRHPADWLMKALVPLLDLSKQEHKFFLHSYLRQGSHTLISASLKTVATKIITQSLSTLAQERRGETWVQSTISALAKIPTSESRNLLEEIASRKKMLFLSDWPVECRKAAEKALISTKKSRH